jgi:hypothetical protein
LYKLSNDWTPTAHAYIVIRGRIRKKNKNETQLVQEDSLIIKRWNMEKYLLGLGAILVGAFLMSVFTHTEVSAENELKRPKPFVCSVKYIGDYDMQHCETGYLDCAVTSGGISCVKKDGSFK